MCALYVCLVNTYVSKTLFYISICNFHAQGFLVHDTSLGTALYKKLDNARSKDLILIARSILLLCFHAVGFNSIFVQKGFFIF